MSFLHFALEMVPTLNSVCCFSQPYNIALVQVNFIYHVVGYLSQPKALQIYKKLTWFMASNLPLAHWSLAPVVIILPQLFFISLQISE